MWLARPAPIQGAIDIPRGSRARQLRSLTVAELRRDTRRCLDHARGLLNEAHSLSERERLGDDHLAGMPQRRGGAKPVTQRGWRHFAGDWLALMAVERFIQADVKVVEKALSRTSRSQVCDRRSVVPRGQDAFENDVVSRHQGSQRAGAQHSPAGDPILVFPLQDDSPEVVFFQDRNLVRARTSQFSGDSGLPGGRRAPQYDQATALAWVRTGLPFVKFKTSCGRHCPSLAVADRTVTPPRGGTSAKPLHRRSASVDPSTQEHGASLRATNSRQRVLAAGLISACWPG
jgi:hypothetical protein